MLIEAWAGVPGAAGAPQPDAGPASTPELMPQRVPCRFITALTRGGPSGMPRPIEVHAHDPQRYLGDMLAWVHQALASERDLLVALFGAQQEPPQQQRQSEPGPDTAEQQAEPPSAALGSTTALLDRIFESICRPLKARPLRAQQPTGWLLPTCQLLPQPAHSPPRSRKPWQPVPCWQRVRQGAWAAAPPWTRGAPANARLARAGPHRAGPAEPAAAGGRLSGGPPAGLLRGHAGAPGGAHRAAQRHAAGLPRPGRARLHGAAARTRGQAVQAAATAPRRPGGAPGGKSCLGHRPRITALCVQAHGQALLRAASRGCQHVSCQSLPPTVLCMCPHCSA